MEDKIFIPVFTAGIVIVSIFQILKIKVAKPKGIWYGIFGILAIAMLVIYLVVI